MEPLEVRALLASGAGLFDHLADDACGVSPSGADCDPVTHSPDDGPSAYLAEGEGDVSVQLRLEVTDTEGALISSAFVGERFHLNVYVQDKVDPAEGVFAAYLDIAYEAGIVDAHDLVYGNVYNNILTGSTKVDGVVDEAGAAGNLQPLGGDELFLFRVPFTAVAPGSVNFQGEPADIVPQSDVLRYGNDLKIPTNEVVYGNAQIEIQLPSVVDFDFGDAPDPTFATLSSNDGPYHLLYANAPRLGATVDADTDGQPNATATGDDDDGSNDDDGIVNSPRFAAGRPVTVEVDAPLGGMLDAWIDLNANGIFDHPAEHLNQGESVELDAGINSIDVTLPDTAVPGLRGARLRISTFGHLNPTGPAGDGEVEDYLVPIDRAFIVNSTNDDGDTNLGDGICDTGATVGEDAECTLRAAMEQANATGNTSAGPDRIFFDIPGDGTQTISPAAALPTITAPVVIDGTTQVGYAGMPLIEIDGSGAGAGVSGLTIVSGDTSVLGLAINRFAANGILLSSGGGNTIQKNAIGTNPLGLVDLGNNSHGVLMFNSSDNLVGGPTPGEANVISGNTGHGVYITRAGSSNNEVKSNLIGLGSNGLNVLGNGGAGVRIDQSASGNIIGGSGNIISSNASAGVVIVGAGSTNNTVAGNKIGTDISGLLRRGNLANGVAIENAPGNQIGVPGDGNLISGNAINGISLSGTGTTGTLIQGNMIGLDMTGEAALSNRQNGVDVFNAPSNTLGGPAEGAGNIISGNDQNGLFVFGASATGNKIEGNFIGTNVDGDSAVGNRQFGAVIREAPNNTLGGTAPGTGNVVSGNLQPGVAILNTGATGNVVIGNLIGTDVTGMQDVGNDNTGVLIWKAPGNRVGGTTAAERNVISGNALFGVRVSTFLAADNVVQGNYIGTDITGAAPLPNDDTGVNLANTQNVIVGGDTPGARNVISGNGNHGVVLTGGGSRGNRVQGNFIGVDASGTQTLGNSKIGVQISDGSRENLIGGATAGTGNVISANGANGVLLTDEATNGNLVAGNLIGTDLTGTVDLGNASNGIGIVDAHTNTIGGTSLAARNVISGNDLFGVSISGETATGNTVSGNAIGTDITGTQDLGNASTGVLLAAPNNTIGGTEVGAGNLISGNNFVGIRINGSATTGNKIQGNLIGTQGDGTSPLGNTGQGIRIDLASDNLIGGVDGGNVIASNSSHGLVILGAATGNAILGNEFFSNGGLGIDLNLNGPTPNDTAPGDEDIDTGPNNLQNFPVLVSAALAANLTIEYSIPTLPANATYDITVEFFLADVSGAEGRTFLGSDTYTVDDAIGTTSITIPAVGASLNDRVVATATDADGNTSEFSANIAITAFGTPDNGPGEGAAGEFVASDLASSNAISSTEVSAPWQNPIDRHDVNNNGVAGDPVGDILSLINEVNRLTFIDAQGNLPPTAASPNLFFDVNGDGRLTPVGDILTQINFVNQRDGQEGEGPAVSQPLAASVATSIAAANLLNPPQPSPSATASAQHAAQPTPPWTHAGSEDDPPVRTELPAAAVDRLVADDVYDLSPDESELEHLLDELIAVIE